MLPQPPQPPKSNSQQSDKEKILADYSVRLGIRLPTEAEITREFNPTLEALNKKLRELSVDIGQTNPLLSPSKIVLLTRSITGMIKGTDDAKKSILGLSDALGEKLGLGKSWATNTARMLNYAMMSKNVKDANRELYESMGPLGKMFTTILSSFSKNKDMFSRLNGTSTGTQAEDDQDTRRHETSLSRIRERLAEIMKRKRALQSGEVAGNSAQVAPEALAASTNGMNRLATASTIAGEEGTAALAGIGLEAAVLTGGILLVVAAVAAVGKAFYSAAVMAISLRDRMKEIDTVFGGVGEKTLFDLQKQLFNVNSQMSGLGIAIGQVNKVIANSLNSGVSWVRATSVSLNTTIQELAGATGRSSEEVGKFFSELIRKIRLSDETIKASANALITYKNNVLQFSDLGSIGFDHFSEAINSSSNALLIAQRHGNQFAKNMMADLAAMTGAAVTFGMSISELNSKFEESGSLITSATSGFRDLLVVSGGAGINNLMSNQFDKTEGMLKMATFLQDLNKQFGNNINLTAQVAQQTWGLSKEASLQLLNVTEAQKSHVREMKNLLLAMGEDAVSKSYKNVTASLSDTWEKIKVSVLNLFERAVGGSSGLSQLQTKLAQFADKLKDVISGSTGQKVMNFFTRILDSASGWISNTIDKIEKILDDMTNTNGSIFDVIGRQLKVVFGTLISMLFAGAKMMGKLIMFGMLEASPRLKMLFGSSEEDSKDTLWSDGSNQDTQQAKQLSSVGVQLSETIKNINSEIQRNQNILSSYDSVGAQGTDLTYGKNKAGVEGFMTVAERQFVLQEEIAKKAAEKEAEEKKLQKERDEVQIQIRDTLVEKLGDRRYKSDFKSYAVKESPFEPGNFAIMGS